MNKYYPGNKILLENTFRNKATGVKQNPTTVTLYVYQKGADRYTIEEADLTNDATGEWSYIYHIPLDTQKGVWYYGFYGQEADDTSYAYTEKSFYIRPSHADPYD